MLSRFRATYYEFAAEELFIVEFHDGALRFVERLHLHKREAFRTLVVLVGYDFCVLHLPDAVEEFEQIAFRCLEGKVADVKSRRSDLYLFGLTRGSRLRF
jgi:hypothetical protein